MKINWQKEIDKIIELFKNNVPYEQIGRLYEVSGAAIKKGIKKHGFILPNKRKINKKEHFNKGKHKDHICLNCGCSFKHKSTSYNKFCSKNCANEYHKKEKINDWKNHPWKYNGEWTYDFIKQFLMEKHNYCCEKCGWHEINQYTNTTPLEIHHIDGDCTNNKEENLQLLCPNCHSLTETFGAKNKNSKRYKLKKYKKEFIVNYITSLNSDEKKNILNELNNS
jgi:hypothetical protein